MGRLAIAIFSVTGLLNLVGLPGNEGDPGGSEAAQQVGDTSQQVAGTSEAAERVVLLHGLGRTAWSMSLLALRLEREGFAVLNIDYPSRRASIDELTTHVSGRLQKAEVATAPRVHFVTHSLGGIITRALLESEPPENLGRVVMLSPPNQGSEIVDALADNPLFEWALGPAAADLGTDRRSAPQRLGPAQFELGVITGSRSLNPVASWMLTGDDDGKVAVERARVEGMQDFLVVQRTHTFIMNSAEVTRQIVHFLRQGTFDHPAPLESRAELQASDEID